MHHGRQNSFGEDDMEKMTAFCGIVCSECPVFLATQADDDRARKEVAELWSKRFGFDMKPEDANCDGCQAKDGRLFSHCRTCEIRRCGNEKQLGTCASCPDYACRKLQDFHALVPYAKKALDRLKR
jgi:hypothetical protein